MIRSYLGLALMGLYSLEATAFVNSGRAARTTALRAEVADLMESAKSVFGGSTDGVSDQLENSAAGAGGLFSSLDLPPEVLAGVGVVALIVIAASASGGGSDDTTSKPAGRSMFSKKKSKVDLSIPYDAAARLAFDDWAASQDNAETSEKAFEKFKTMYEVQAVAEVTAKQMKRNMESFDPTKPPPAPRPAPKPKTVKVVKVDTSKTPFFAEIK